MGLPSRSSEDRGCGRKVRLTVDNLRCRSRDAACQPEPRAKRVRGEGVAERVGFELLAVLWILQVAESTLPGLPSIPAMPSRLAPDCTGGLPRCAPDSPRSTTALVSVNRTRTRRERHDSAPPRRDADEHSPSSEANRDALAEERGDGTESPSRRSSAGD